MTVKSELAPIVERLGYVASILDANASKFTVPDHIPAKARTVREAADIISDLLEALELVDAMFSNPGSINKSSVRDKVRGAIARARGETTDAQA